MICPDVNLLLYASYTGYPQHESARQWWEETLSSGKLVRIGHVVVLGFIRIMTNPRILENPLTVDRAIEVVDGWLSLPNVELIGPAESHWTNLARMLNAGRVGGNLTTDAHIAALAADYGLIVHTNDADFARFPGIQTRNPLQ